MKLLFRFASLALLALFAGPLTAEEIPARLEWAQRVPLGSCASARVTAVHVNVGDRVVAGQDLVELDPVPAIARLRRAQAILDRSRPELEEREIALENAQALFDRTVLSASELRRAEIRHAIGMAAVAEAEAGVTLAEAGLECRKVRSPLDGIVVERKVERGQPVVGTERAPTLVVVAASGEMDAVTWVPLDRLSTLTRGTPVKVRARDKRYSGRVFTVGLEPVVQEPLSYSVRIRFSTVDDEQLRAGMAVVVEFP